MDVAVWLRALGLERYEQAFRENDVDGELLRLAGPLSGEALDWFTPTTEHVRDVRRRLW